MKLFSVKKSKKDNDFIVQIPIGNLFGIVYQLFELHHNNPSLDIDDSNYVLRMSSKGLLELGYKEDKWNLV